jgi:hypothetical protein
MLPDASRDANISENSYENRSTSWKAACAKFRDFWPESLPMPDTAIAEVKRYPGLPKDSLISRSALRFASRQNAEMNAQEAPLVDNSGLAWYQKRQNHYKRQIH